MLSFLQPHLFCAAAQHADEVLAVPPGCVAAVSSPVEGHFPLQTADVSMAEVVAELVNLEGFRKENTQRFSGRKA